MPTRSQSASTSLRMCEERNTVWPRCLASCTLSRKATSISGSRPLVGSSRIKSTGRAASAATSCTFWRLPFDSARTFFEVSSLNRSTSRSLVGAVGSPVQAGEELECLGTVEGRPEERLPGDVGHATVGSDRIAPGVEPEDLGAPARRAVQSEQEPDRRRLAGPVRPEIAVDLAFPDLEVEGVQGQGPPVALGQFLRADGAHVSFRVR
jgi:hypothetical protein